MTEVSWLYIRQNVIFKYHAIKFLCRPFASYVCHLSATFFFTSWGFRRVSALYLTTHIYHTITFLTLNILKLIYSFLLETGPLGLFNLFFFQIHVQDKTVSVFETTIRILGGLLSAHLIASDYATVLPSPSNAILCVILWFHKNILVLFECRIDLPAQDIFYPFFVLFWSHGSSTAQVGGENSIFSNSLFLQS